MSEERLARIETKVDNLIDQNRVRGEKDDVRWDRIARIVYGSEGKGGLLVKVDRLEQAHERQRSIIRLLSSSFLTALGSFIVWLLTKK